MTFAQTIRQVTLDTPANTRIRYGYGSGDFQAERTHRQTLNLNPGEKYNLNFNAIDGVAKIIHKVRYLGFTLRNDTGALLRIGGGTSLTNWQPDILGPHFTDYVTIKPGGSWIIDSPAEPLTRPAPFKTLTDYLDLIDGATPQQPLFAAYNPDGGAGSCPYNAHWLNQQYLPGIKTYQGLGVINFRSNRCGTLITPRHIIYADHFPVSGTVTFVDPSGNPHNYTLSASQYVDEDIRVGRLNTDVTPSLTPLSIPDPTFETYFYPGGIETLPYFACLVPPNYAPRINRFSISSANFGTTPCLTDDPQFPFTGGPTTGDSGNPYVTLTPAGQPILLGHPLFPTGGPLYSHFCDQIDNAIESLSPGGGYAITRYPGYGFGDGADESRIQLENLGTAPARVWIEIIGTKDPQEPATQSPTDGEALYPWDPESSEIPIGTELPSGTTRFSKAAAWLHNSLKAANAETVTYRRGDEQADIPAIRGGTTYQTADAVGSVITTARAVDWIITATDLTLPNIGATQPETGDIIETADAVYQVLPLGSLSPWQWHGPAKNVFRIHTKHIGA